MDIPHILPWKKKRGLESYKDHHSIPFSVEGGNQAQPLSLQTLTLEGKVSSTAPRNQLLLTPPSHVQAQNGL